MLTAPTRRCSLAGLLVALASALLQLGPLLGRGYVLVQDMVFVPREPLGTALLGLDGVPRAVPSDLVVALASRVLPGDAVQDIVLVAILVGAGWGAARLVPTASVWGAAAAAAFYSWNPYVTERLALGQWALLVGYATLPWTARAALALRLRVPRAGPRLALTLAVAALGGASAVLLAGLVAVLVTGVPTAASPPARWRAARLAAGSAVATLLVSLPWAVSGLLQPGGIPADPSGVTAFAAGADTPFGTLASLLSLGGIWDSGVVPRGRDSLFPALAALVLTAVAVWGVTRTATVWGRRAAAALAVAAAAGLVLAVASSVPGGEAVMRGAVVHLPGGGVLRDAQKWVAPLAVLVAVGLGMAAAELSARWRPAGALLALAPLAVLPSAALAQRGRLAAVHWPAAWSQVTAASDAGPAGPVLVLPWDSYRAYPWNGDRLQLDPASRWLDHRVVGQDALQVGDTLVAGEDPLARRLDPAVESGAPLLPALARAGVSQVLVELTTVGGADQQRRVAGLTPILTTPQLALYDVPHPAAVSQPEASLAPVVVGDGVAGGFALFCGVLALPFGRTRCRGTDPAVCSPQPPGP